MPETVHTKHLKKKPFSRSTVPCPSEMMVESSPMWMGMDLPVYKDEKESFSANMWFKAPESIKSACLEGMTFFMLWFPILLISPPKAFRKIDVISLKERGRFIKFLLHVGMFRVEALPAIRTLDFFLSIVPFPFVLP